MKHYGTTCKEDFSLVRPKLGARVLEAWQPRRTIASTVLAMLGNASSLRMFGKLTVTGKESFLTQGQNFF